MATRFQRELLPAPKTFYERELGKLSRPRSGWAMGRCPFHKSKSGKSFSVNIESGGFHCFGCDARGADVLTFVMLRDRLNFKAAAQSLGAWRDVTSAERSQIDATRAKQQQEREQAAEAAELDRRRRLDLRAEIHATAALQRDVCDRLSEIWRGELEAYPGEAEICWGTLVDAHEDLELTEVEYMREIGL